MAFAFIGTVISAINVTAASVNVTIPATALDGRLLVLTVYHREVLTVPPGWTLIASGASPGAVNTQMSAYYTVASGHASTVLTVSGAASNRLEIGVSVFTVGGPFEVGFAQAYQGNHLVEVPADVLLYNQGLDLLVAGYDTTTSTGNTSVTPSAAFTQIYGSSASQRRAGVAYKTPTSASDYRAMQSNQTTANNGVMLFIRLQEVDNEPDAQTAQLATLSLVGTAADIRVPQYAIQVLWGTGSVAEVSQYSVLVLARTPPRRIITITD